MLVSAEDMPLKDGRILHDVNILEQGVDYVRVAHNEGISRVYATNLTNDWREKLHLLPEQVAEKKNMLAARNEENARQQKERDLQLRESLSEAEKMPRYIRGTDILKMVSAYATMDSLEAEAAALRWNMAEATRVGMSDQAEYFKVQLVAFEPGLTALRERREENTRRMMAMHSEYEKALNASNEKMAQLSSQISTIRQDLKEVSTRPTETKVVYREPYYTTPRIVVPAVQRETVIVSPPRNICPPSRPVNVSTTRNTISVGPGTSFPSSSVRPATVTPAVVHPAKVTPAIVQPARRFEK